MLRQKFLGLVMVLILTAFVFPKTSFSALNLEEDAPGELQTAPPEENKTSGISLSGSANYLAKFLSATSLGNSLLYELNGNVGIGTTEPVAFLDVAGRALFNYEPFAYGSIDSEDDWHAITGGYTNGSLVYGGDFLGFDGVLGNAIAYIGSGEIIPKGWSGTLSFTGYADASNFAQTTQLQGSSDGGATWSTLASMSDSPDIQTLTWSPRPAIASYRLRVVMNTTNGISPGQTIRLQNLTITQLPLFNFGTTQTAGLRLRNDNVGIGTVNPLDKLEVAGNLTVGAYDHVFNDVVIRAAGGCPNCGYNSESGSNLVLRSGIGTGIGPSGDIIFQVSDDANWGNQQPHGILEAMRVQTTSGNVGIGVPSPSQRLDVLGYVRGQSGLCIGDDCRTSWPSGGSSNADTLDGLDSSQFLRSDTSGTLTGTLSVNGTIRAKEIKVETGWSDFVFEPNYPLMPLKDLAGFIASHKHLPEIPTAKDVELNGIEVGNIQSKLLQKIEELTLYILELEQRLKAVENAQR